MRKKILLTTDVPSTNLGWTYTFGEVKELWEEIKSLNIKGIRNEACDVYTCAMCAITTHTGIPIPIFWKRSAIEWLNRIEVWKDIFKVYNLHFDIKYLVNGGNYKKPEKVKKAINLACKEQRRNKYANTKHDET